MASPCPRSRRRCSAEVRARGRSRARGCGTRPGARRCRRRPRRRRAPRFLYGPVSLRSQLLRGRGHRGRRSRCPLLRMEFANRRPRPPASCSPSGYRSSSSGSWYPPKRTFGRDFSTYCACLVKRYTGMLGEAVFVLDTERAALRLRLGAAALATSLILLAGDATNALGPATIPMFVAAAVVLRFGSPGRMPKVRALVGSVLDVVAATAIVFALPLTAPSWILYGFAIANAALWRGPLGVFGATAASILAYDVTLGLRTGEAPAVSLWVVQALIAIGLISAELVYSAARPLADRERMRRHGHALRAFAEARGSAALLDTLRAQILALGAAHVRLGTEEKALKESLGDRPGLVMRLPTHEPRYIAVILPADVAGAPEIATIARDLIADIAPMMASNERAEGAERLRDATFLALDALADT